MNKNTIIIIVVSCMLLLLISSSVGGGVYYQQSQTTSSVPKTTSKSTTGTSASGTSAPTTTFAPTTTTFAPTTTTFAPTTTLAPKVLPNDIDKVSGWSGAHENPGDKNQTAEDCRQKAINSNGKYAAWGFRKDTHPDPNWKNTCFLYTTPFNQYKGDLNDTVHETGCLQPGQKVEWGCLTKEQVEQKVQQQIKNIHDQVNKAMEAARNNINAGICSSNSNNGVCNNELKSSKCNVRMQDDGNLVVYSNGSPVWASNTNGKGTGPYKLVMQADGNLVVYDSKNSPQWASNTNGKGSGPYQARMQNDCNFVVYDSTNTPYWASNTSGK